MLSFLLNREIHSMDCHRGTPVLDILRGVLDMKGTREGCGDGDCGACTVLLGTKEGPGVSYLAVNSCLLPADELHGRHLVTVEGLSPERGLSVLQEAVAEHGASQCGFCTPGMVVSLTGYFMGTLAPAVGEAMDSLGGNICRCTGYASIRRAVESLCRRVPGSPAEHPGSPEHLRHLAGVGILPDWFPGAAASLSESAASETAGEDLSSCTIVAGGTDLTVTGRDRLSGEPLRFLSRDPSLSAVSVEEGEYRIGAGTTVSDLASSPLASEVEGLSEALTLVASTQVRNRATVGGNIVNASPIGDLCILLLVFDAMLSIDGRSGPRQVPLRTFHTGYREMDIRPGEIIRAVSLPVSQTSMRFSFEKVSMREHLDIASVNSASRMAAEDGILSAAALSAGGVAPVPMHLKRTSRMLIGRDVSPATAIEASRSAMDEIEPISDVRGSAEYKRTLLGRLVLAHFLKLFPDSIDYRELNL